MRGSPGLVPREKLGAEVCERDAARGGCVDLVCGPPHDLRLLPGALIERRAGCVAEESVGPECHGDRFFIEAVAELG